MIKINHLRKEYANITPLKDVNVHIHKGDVISIIGPSGTGKSTLIRCINMLETPTSGEIWVGDERITDKKCNINKIRQGADVAIPGWKGLHGRGSGGMVMPGI